MTVVLLKALHIGAIAIWAAGLICLPFLFRQRGGLEDGQDLHRLHAMVRFFYVVVLSPAAFIAIASGTGLIFLQQTFEVWFSVKLLLVGMLVVAHVLSGLLILKLFEEAGRYPIWRYLLVTATTTVIVTAILFVVSAKPAWDATEFGREWFMPGRLGEWLESRVGLAPYLRSSIINPTP